MYTRFVFVSRALKLYETRFQDNDYTPLLFLRDLRTLPTVAGRPRNLSPTLAKFLKERFEGKHLFVTDL